MMDICNCRILAMDIRGHGKHSTQLGFGFLKNLLKVASFTLFENLKIYADCLLWYSKLVCHLFVESRGLLVLQNFTIARKSESILLAY